VRSPIFPNAVSRERGAALQRDADYTLMDLVNTAPSGRIYTESGQVSECAVHYSQYKEEDKSTPGSLAFKSRYSR
jgi:hypothetical protein